MKPKYWYKYTSFECPVCGGGVTYKERQETPRPEEYEKRHEWINSYDHCLE